MVSCCEHDVVGEAKGFGRLSAVNECFSHTEVSVRGFESCFDARCGSLANAFDSISCTTGSWAFVVFTLVCLPVYASVALRVATSLSVMPHPLVVPFTEFAVRLERTWESQASLQAQRATRGQEEDSRRRSRASSSTGLGFSKLTERF